MFSYISKFNNYVIDKIENYMINFVKNNYKYFTDVIPITKKQKERKKLKKIESQERYKFKVIGKSNKFLYLKKEDYLKYKKDKYYSILINYVQFVNPLTNIVRDRGVFGELL